MMGERVEYTVYSRKTTLPVAFGRPRECAGALGVTKKTFLEMASRSRRRADKRFIIIKEDPAMFEETGG